MTINRIEYRVVPITRYQITRYEEGVDDDREGAPSGSFSGVTQNGTFENVNVAYEVAYALASAEHTRLGWPLGDERMQYPKGDPRYDAAVVA